MIEQLTIERFKSIRSLTLPCRKVNLFVGAPDTGKTNILEALAFLSRLGWDLPIGTDLRLSPELGFDSLFYRQFFDSPLRISMQLTPKVQPELGTSPTVTASVEGPNRALLIDLTPVRLSALVGFGDKAHFPVLRWIRYYLYTSSAEWRYRIGPFEQAAVSPPHGSNLLYLARHDSRVYEFLKDMVSALSWRLRFDQAQKTFRLSEVRQDEILDYNLDLLSDSLKRLFFYGAILLTSQSATLVLDEPDVFAFPPYPKTLGEMIAGDASNQLFLTTHNPYFLAGLLEKTPADKLALFVCQREADGGTSATLVPPKGVARAIEHGASVFFNLEDLLDPSA